jgi:ABC-type multidrug transport system permease subunit
MTPGFKYLSDQLFKVYSSGADNSSMIYIILLSCFVGICLPVLLRVFFINKKLN